MGFRTYCTHKGCREEMEPVVDKETLQAFCTSCGEELTNIDIFMRRQMAFMGQTRKAQRKRLAHMVSCPSCKNEAPPTLGPKQELLCSSCKKEFTHISGPVAQLMKESLRTLNNDKSYR